MQFLVLSQRRLDDFTPEQFDAVIPAETDVVRNLYADGILRSIWLRDDLPGAAFILESADLAEARSTVAALPMAAGGLSTFTVIPLQPYRGFGPR